MLPFMKNRKEASLAAMPDNVVKRSPDNPDSDTEEMHYLEACIGEFVDAVKAGNIKAATRAFKDACEVVDSMPHQEGEHF